MKRNLFGLIVLLVVILIALLCSCNTPNDESINTNYDSLSLNDSIIRSCAYNYAEQLIKDGYCVKWAYHKAYVEYAIIPIDSLYYAIEED